MKSLAQLIPRLPWFMSWTSLLSRNSSTNLHLLLQSESFYGGWKLAGWGGSFLMVYRNNAGRLGAGFHQCAVRNILAGSKRWFLCPGMTLQGISNHKFSKERGFPVESSLQGISSKLFVVETKQFVGSNPNVMLRGKHSASLSTRGGLRGRKQTLSASIASLFFPGHTNLLYVPNIKI